MVKVYISFEGDFPSWSDYCLDQSRFQNLESYIHDLIVAIEWCSDKKVKALKLESMDDNFDPIYRVVK